MSDHERGAYTPPTDSPLSFDARQPVRGARPVPVTLIVSILVLVGLAVAIFVFYRSGVRQAGQPPQTMGAPVGAMKSPPPPEAQPQDPAAGLQIYNAEGGAHPAPPANAAPQFAPPPEQPQARAEPPAPKVVVAPLPAAQPAPNLRPSIQTAPPPAPVAKPASIAPAAKLPPAAPVAPPPAAKAPVAKPPAPKPAPAPPPPAAKAAAPTPAPAAKAGAAGVQIGAFSSQALADKGWNDAAAIAPGPAAGKGKSVEKVDKDGHTLFRTTVTGFASRADATAFCDKLKAAGKACFVK